MSHCTDDHINPLCEEKFENIENGVAQILKGQTEHTTTLKNINDRLFVDNGRASVQTKLNVHETFIKVHLWLYGIVFSGIILATIGILVTRALS
jgi:hypothetical protein